MARMKILLTNDDGIDAPGLAALENAARSLGELLIVAPDQHLSGCSHQTTTDRDLELRELSANRFSLDGTPADCVRVALLHLASDIDVVLSGINDGGNLGVDVFMSGTVAAAREAALFGKQALAISQYRRRGSVFNSARAADWARDVIATLLTQAHEPATFWNINLPDPAKEGQPPIVNCHVDGCRLPVAFERTESRFKYRGNYQARERGEGSDVAHCFAGAITVTQIRLSGAG